MNVSRLHRNQKVELQIEEVNLDDRNAEMDDDKFNPTPRQETATSTTNSESSGRGFWKSKVLRSDSFRGFYATAVGDDSNALYSDSGIIRPSSRPWKTAFFRFGPLSGLFCMCKFNQWTASDLLL